MLLYSESKGYWFIIQQIINTQIGIINTKSKVQYRYTCNKQSGQQLSPIPGKGWGTKQFRLTIMRLSKL